MKKITFWKSLFLLCALIVGSSSAWADDNYTQVTSVDDLDTDATYIIGDVTNNTVKAFGALSSSRGTIISSDLSVTGTTITVASDATSKPLEFTLTKSGDYYLISYGSTPTYLTYSSGTTFGTTTTTPTTDGGKWNIAYNSTYSCLLINNVATTARYILRNGNSAYGPYSNTNLSSYGKATLYKKSTEKTNPIITFNNGSVRVGKTLDVSTLFSSNSTGTVNYSITAGDSYATLSGSTLTGVAEGSVTVKAEQAAAGTYNAGEASATITVQEALTLSSIDITTTPTKTTYLEGETFDATGMVVTATYSDESTDDVTALCTWSPNGALTPTDDKIIVSYTENSVTKTAEQAITVNEYTQPTLIEITPNYEFFGKTAQYSGNTYNEVSGTKDYVTVTQTRNGSNMYANTTALRFYKSNTLEIASPEDYLISKIEFEISGTSNDITSNKETYDADNGVWEGCESSVTFTRPSDASSYATISKITVTLARKLDVAYADGWMSYVTPCDVTFPDNVEAYIVTAIEPGITREKITAAPEGTPVILHATDGIGSYGLPVPDETPDALTTNELKVSDGSITIDDSNYKKIYVLTVVSDKAGFGPLAKTKTLAAGKAYIEYATAQSRDFFAFEGETTGISALDNLTNTEFDNAPMYNLAGQRVTKSYKGVVIVNGKKMLNK